MEVEKDRGRIEGAVDILLHSNRNEEKESSGKDIPASKDDEQIRTVENDAAGTTEDGEAEIRICIDEKGEGE